MCDDEAKKKNKTKIDKLIDAIEHLDRTLMASSKPLFIVDPQPPSIESVAKQLARLNDEISKLIGIMSIL